MLLTGSVDNTAVVWDAQSGDIKQVFSFHTGAWPSSAAGTL